MFAVKGWSVDASSLKPQTEVFKSKAREEKNSKKRKRGHPQEAKQDPNIRADDVGRLWEQHVEGGGPTKSQKVRKRKKQKLEQGKDDEEAKPEAGEEEVKAPQEGKKKKKNKSKVEQQADEGAKSVQSIKPKVTNGTAKDGDKNGAVAEITTVLPAKEKLTPMQSAMRQKLVSSRFRYLNQTLYTEPSVKAQQLFDQDPAMFDDYHAGFRQQVSVWPENPLDTFIAEVRRRAKIKSPRNPNRQKTNDELLPRSRGTCTVADLGCGDARLAETLTKANEHTKFHLDLKSFDLYSPSPHVTKADISDLPLKDDSVDVAIFCLALMGTNWISFVEEAYRILHWKGELWIAEIKSRFGRVSRAGKPVEHSVGNKKKQLAMQKARETKQREDQEVNEQEVLQTAVDGVQTSKQETDVSAFVDVLKRRGFVLKPPAEQHVDLSNTMFVKMEFVKAAVPTKGKGVPKEQPKEQPKGAFNTKRKFIPDEDEPATEDEATVLKPCLYKIR
ncbi:25S rRNA (adenine645-N1)-methyltransferase [Saxophila tyrrhenica]|uniref:Ribosomal RNA-processing protein 8 n=1 Tax=Saxophila tyrrhenica TaxID=1690608 RepID=A0AAV9P3T8_9PEZI|nr:25S rRNA (adenine645-N1)-methyltransferase [Saxophila tyrrhenica]